MKVNMSYSTLWRLAGKQQKLLTCLAVSPSRTRLIVASKDCNLLLVNVKDDSVLVELKFKEHFSALVGLWYAEDNVLIGCCNGSLYDVCFNPTNDKHQVTMSPILNQFNQQIWSLAFDPARRLLTVGYGSTVGLFSYSDTGYHSAVKWNTVELIKGPCNNESGVVTTLLFYPAEDNGSKLFIGYAQAGWSIWAKPGSVKHINPDSNHNVSRVGCVILSPNQKFLAISTLDHTIVLYALGRNGPLLESMQEFPYEDSASINPIVPVAFPSDGLVLASTACGEVPMIQSTDGEMSLLHHEQASHIIRVIATHGQRIIVGSSSEPESVLKCYSSSVVVTAKPRTDELIVVNITEALSGWESGDNKMKATSSTLRSIWCVAMSRSAWVWILGMAVLATLIMSASPPGGPVFEGAKEESDSTDVMIPGWGRNYYWVFFSVRHFCRFIAFQIRVWTAWVFNTAWNFFVEAIWVVLHTLNIMVWGAAKWGCEPVEYY
ncbi:hypothetical protein FS749_012085 [Ceratobasidium sp. UAMH 11750]|nr:hypothetical protein FS749_012085 [Ceratobasidium sp. UAMH 11750]